MHRFYAHTLPPPHGPESWEPLQTHLESVAKRCAEFAEPLGAERWGRLLGLWHDVGKYAPAFQAYLYETAPLEEDDPHRRELKGKVEHAAAGAYYAAQQLGAAGQLLAYGIAGHHAGLPNTVAAEGEQERSSLRGKVKSARADTREALAHAPAGLLEQAAPPLPPLTFDRQDGRLASFQAAFFVRMLFSCLVDADYLETERFLDPQRAEQRPDGEVALAQLATRLDDHLHRLQQRSDDTPVNRCRRQVLDACIAAAGQGPGLFSLTVPTGGGKTLSSLAFALRHAEAHGLSRVILAIPFTSIIEQNAAVYRRALAPLGQQVLEHHSNLDPGKQADESERNRLAAENWDAPLIVTTNVQLLESLFAARPGRCRKLHRIARSVIVLDEAQALPPHLLKPTLAALGELIHNYGCTVVLCTATQPALERREEFPIGLTEPRPIIPAAQREALFATLKRVEVRREGVIGDGALVDRLAEHPQVLCIVNTRRHAAELFGALTQKLGETHTRRRHGIEQADVATCLHLSANMCPRHRSAVLRLIRRRLATGRPCRVISTQLVEAGVDVDFPVVYRAMAGLDAIAQAAGRCNREGQLKGPGRVIVFEPDRKERREPPFVRQPAQMARQVVADHDDPLTPEAQHQYFRLHYWDEGGRSGWDRPPGAPNGDASVMDCFGGAGEYLQFREAAQRYRLIEDNQHPVLIPYGRRGSKLIRHLQRMPEPPGTQTLRHLQQQVVTVHEPIADRLLNNRVLLPPDQGHGQLILGNEAAYDRRTGLVSGAGGLDPSGLVF